MILLLAILFACAQAFEDLDPDRYGPTCIDYVCRKELQFKSPFLLDKVNKRWVDGNWVIINFLCKRCREFGQDCYCCGERRYYVEYGNLCLRYCLQELIKGQRPREPCRPKENVGKTEPKSDYDNYDYGETLPHLTPLIDIECN